MLSQSRRLVRAGTLVLGIKQAVPEGEEGLGEVGLDTPVLVVDVMVGSVVAGNELEGVPWELVTAVVIDSLDCRHGKKPHALTNSHESNLESNGGSKGVEKEALKGVIIKSTIGIRHIETVVSRVEGSCRCVSQGILVKVHTDERLATARDCLP